MIDLPRVSRRAFSSTAAASILATSLLIPGAIHAAAGVSPQITCGPDKPDQPGLISATEYESPTYRTRVTWDDIWEVGDDSNPAVAAALGTFVKPVDCGVGNGGSDSLALSHRLSPTAAVVIQVYQRGFWTFDSMVSDMRKPGWVANLHLPQSSAVLLTDHTDNSLAMLARDIDDPDHIVYQEAYFPPDDDTYIMSVTLHISDPDAYAPILSDAEAIAIEDFTLYTVTDPDTILDVIAS